MLSQRIIEATKHNYIVLEKKLDALKYLYFRKSSIEISWDSKITLTY